MPSSSPSSAAVRTHTIEIQHPIAQPIRILRPVRDLRSLVLAPLSVRTLQRLCQSSSLSLAVLGSLWLQGSGSNALAQSIPVLPPLEPASVEVEEGNEPIADIDTDPPGIDVSEPDGLENDTSVDSIVDDLEGLELTDEPLVDNLETDDLETDDLETDDLEIEVLETDNLETDDLEIEVLETDDLDIEDLETGDLDIEDLDIEDLETEELEIEDLETGDLEIEDLETEELEIEDLETGDLEIEVLETDDLPLNDALNGTEDRLPINEENNVVPAPIQIETFKPSQGSQIFEDVVLTPSAMANPTTLRGISGGPLTASRVAGRTDTVTGICTGFVDRNPDHRIELTEFFDYLSLQVESPEDTVLVVRGPGGSWCNDDVAGFNPGLTGEWFSGVYDVWVGSYNEQTYHPYVIRLSDSQ